MAAHEEPLTPGPSPVTRKPFYQRLSEQRRVLHALVLREINGRHAGSRVGYLWSFINPLIGILVLYLLFTTIRQRDLGGMPLLMFLVTGWFTYGFYTTLVNSLGNAVQANRSLLMHQNVTRLDVVAARIVLELLTTTAMLLIGTLVGGVIDGSELPSDLGLVTISFFGAGLFGASLGLFICSISPYFPYAMNFLGPFNRIGFFMSGVLFTASMLPSWTYEFIKWNPLLHPIEGMRQGWFGTYQSPVLDLQYTYMIAVPMLTISLVLERRTRKDIKFS